jgi:hypothetical protein
MMLWAMFEKYGLLVDLSWKQFILVSTFIHLYPKRHQVPPSQASAQAFKTGPVMHVILWINQLSPYTHALAFPTCSLVHTPSL